MEGLIGYPLGRNFSFTNVRVTNCSTLVDATKIAAEKPLAGLSLLNITGNCTNGISLSNITDTKLRDIHIAGFKGAFLSTTNVQGTGLEDLNR